MRHPFSLIQLVIRSTAAGPSGFVIIGHHGVSAFGGDMPVEIEHIKALIVVVLEIRRGWLFGEVSSRMQVTITGGIGYRIIICVVCDSEELTRAFDLGGFDRTALGIRWVGRAESVPPSVKLIAFPVVPAVDIRPVSTKLVIFDGCIDTVRRDISYCDRAGEDALAESPSLIRIHGNCFFRGKR